MSTIASSSTLRRDTTPISAMFVMISAAQDHEKSAGIRTVDKEFSFPATGKSGGVFTSALLQVLNEISKPTAREETISWMQFMERLRTIIHEKGFKNQVPQLTCSVEMNVHEPFTIFPKFDDTTKGDNKKKKNKQQRRQRAILIAINYVDQPPAWRLTGCHNDLKNVKSYLTEHHGFDERDMAILMDDGKHAPPTKANILMAFELMTMHSDPGDVVFLHYSGHGQQYEDKDGDEIDGKDESMLPCDFTKNGPLLDDHVYEKLVLPMKKGVHVVSLVDSCHSGTVLDLPFVIQVGEKHMRRSTRKLLRGLTKEEQEADDDFDSKLLTDRQVEMRKLSALPFRESFSASTRQLSDSKADPTVDHIASLLVLHSDTNIWSS
ncbi:unnamed protein product [Cylindrotheca closterium]|uniref:Peptidase C14 caspase domain-containing protein n=1 Tax=Cylindrotheca closterium TaxID=2856 RepID=A0AAD2FNR6_9STRA|nr:unnamed protein product [Cylindrotheca closterium]